jgi:uncharacterized protein (DUF2267 family)
MKAPKKLIVVASACVLLVATAIASLVAGGPIRSAAAPLFNGGGNNKANTNAGLPDMFGSDFGVMGFALDPTSTSNCTDFVNKLAANLKVQPADLQAALKTTLLQEIDAAQQANKITAAQAQTLRDKVNQSNGDFCAGLPAGMPGMRGEGAFVSGKLADAAAKVFNISTDQFKQDLKDKGSLQGVAQKYTLDNADTKAKLESALETALRQDLADRKVAQAQIDQIASMFKQNFDQFYTGAAGSFTMPAMPGGMPAMPGGGMPFGPGGHGDGGHHGPWNGAPANATPQSQ